MFVAVYCFAFSPNPLAQESPRSLTTAELADLSLEDLMEIRVITASKTEEPLPRTTSVMSVITARDIQRRDSERSTRF